MKFDLGLEYRGRVILNDTDQIEIHTTIASTNLHGNEHTNDKTDGHNCMIIFISFSSFIQACP
jgi:hypothetical protein